MDIRAATHGRTAAEFKSNHLLRKACQWDFLVIGEAMSRLRKFDEVIVQRITNWQRVIAFRNQLIHGYDIIRDAITWNVVTVHIPILIADIEKLLED